jgi:hypothetical protein
LQLIRNLLIAFKTPSSPQTYPNFLHFLALHKRTVKVIKTQMTFSDPRDSGTFECAGDGLHSVFCQPIRAFDLGNMLFQYYAFQRVRIKRPR